MTLPFLAPCQHCGGRATFVEHAVDSVIYTDLVKDVKLVEWITADCTVCRAVSGSKPEGLWPGTTTYQQAADAWNRAFHDDLWDLLNAYDGKPIPVRRFADFFPGVNILPEVIYKQPLKKRGKIGENSPLTSNHR